MPYDLDPMGLIPPKVFEVFGQVTTSELARSDWSFTSRVIRVSAAFSWQYGLHFIAAKTRYMPENDYRSLKMVAPEKGTLL